MDLWKLRCISVLSIKAVQHSWVLMHIAAIVVCIQLVHYTKAEFMSVGLYLRWYFLIWKVKVYSNEVPLPYITLQKFHMIQNFPPSPLELIISLYIDVETFSVPYSKIIA